MQVQRKNAIRSKHREVSYRAFVYQEKCKPLVWSSNHHQCQVPESPSKPDIPPFDSLFILILSNKLPYFCSMFSGRNSLLSPPGEIIHSFLQRFFGMEKINKLDGGGQSQTRSFASRVLTWIQGKLRKNIKWPNERLKKKTIFIKKLRR